MVEYRQITRECHARLGPSAQAPVVFPAVRAGTVLEVQHDPTLVDDSFFKAQYQGRHVYIGSENANPQDEESHASSFEVSYLRSCTIAANRVDVTPPFLFGRGFVFDGSRRIVTIRRCLLTVGLSRHELPFSDVTVHLGSLWDLDFELEKSVVVRIRDSRPLSLCVERARMGAYWKCEQIFDALQELGVPTSSD